MGRSFHCWLSLAGLMIFSGIALAQEEKRIDETKESRPRTLDTFKLPAGAIFVIGKELRDAAGFAPEMLIFKKKEYDELIERIERVERLLQPGKPQPPSICEISGQIEGDRVRFRLRYRFETKQARTMVALGGQRSWPVAVTMDDGELPLLLPASSGSSSGSGGASGEDGLMVRVEKPGPHVVTLDVEMLAENKGDDRSVNLGLPRAAITRLEQLTVPAAISQVRVNSEPSPGLFAVLKPPLQPSRSGGLQPPGRTVKTEGQDAEHRRLAAMPLGAADHLELTWKGPTTNASSAKALLTAEGRRWDVHVDESGVLSEVTLILQARRGRTKRWQLQLPPQAQVEIKEPTDTDERIQRIELTKPSANASGFDKSGSEGAGSGNPTLTIELKEANGEPLRVVLQVRQNWSERRVAIGPYFVNGAFRQYGVIRVTEPADLRLRYHPRSDVNRRDTSSEQAGDNYVAEFAYWTPTANAPGPEAAAATTAPPLVIEAVKGTVDTYVEHELRWTGPGMNGARPGEASPRGWRAISKIRVTPNRTAIDRLELRIPRDYAYDKEVGATSNNAVLDDVVIDPATAVATIKLQKQSRPFTISLPAFYPVVEGSQQASLELPRPMQSLDRGGQITAILPAEGWEFVPRDEVQPGEHEHTWQFDRAPASIELAWRAFRPELEVHSVVDVTLAGSKARVQQELRIQFQSMPLAVHLQIPPALTGLVRVAQGGKLSPDNQEVTLAKSGDKARVLILEYSFPIDPPTNDAKPIDLPFVKVAEATRTENKVRLWSEPGIVPLVNQALWEETPVEIVADKDELPSLVVRGASMDNALHVSLKEMPGVRPASTIIARALIQVAVDDPGQIYRARFLVTQLHARQLEIALPFPVAQLNLKALVNGKRIQHQPLDEYHFQLDLDPSIYYAKPFILEMRYQVPSELLQQQSGWRTKLTPPIFLNNTFVNRVRWQMKRPEAWVILLPAFGQSWDAKWEWQGGLVAPRPAWSSTDLEGWLADSAATDPSGTLADPIGDLTPGLVCGRGSLASLEFVHVWQPIWLLTCSLALVGAGLGLVIAARSPRWRGLAWLVIGGLGLIALSAAMFWPGIAPAVIYGCEPGIVVVTGLLGAQWLIHQRYRRQVVFLPGFTRVKSGSSIIRARAPARMLEPTTVDAPAKPASEKPEVKS